MRTTLDLPDELMRSVKVRAAQHDRSITEEISALLRAGLAGETRLRQRTVKLPLIRSTRDASVDETSPERMAEILAEGEIDDLRP